MLSTGLQLHVNLKATSLKPGKIAVIRKLQKDDLVKPPQKKIQYIHRNPPIYFQSIPPNFKKWLGSPHLQAIKRPFGRGPPNPIL